jgi:energy-coupling factor transporter ATP-binding protein EcfA2
LKAAEYSSLEDWVFSNPFSRDETLGPGPFKADEIDSIIKCHSKPPDDFHLERYRDAYKLITALYFTGIKTAKRHINLRSGKIDVGCKNLHAELEKYAKEAIDKFGLDASTISTPAILSWIEKRIRAEFIIRERNWTSDLKKRVFSLVCSQDLRRNYERLTREYIPNEKKTEKEIPQQANVLIYGPTGSGKEDVAQVISYCNIDIHSIISGKKRGQTIGIHPMTAVVIASYPDKLIYSHLFGHKKGAFTGADADKGGIFKVIQNTESLFLDEIAELNMESQVMLLRVIQEREYLPLGEDGHGKPNKFLGNIITATNKNLAEEVEARRFREDLFYRLSSNSITLPPLSKLLNDSAFAESCVTRIFESIFGSGAKERYNMDYRKILEHISNKTAAGYSWPGNYRELQRLIYHYDTYGDDFKTETFTKTPSCARDNYSFKDSYFEYITNQTDTRTPSYKQFTVEYYSYLKKKYPHRNNKEISQMMGVDSRTIKKWNDESGLVSTED